MRRFRAPDGSARHVAWSLANGWSAAESDDALRDAHDAGADVRACARIFFHLASKGAAAAQRARPDAIRARG